MQRIVTQENPGWLASPGFFVLYSDKQKRLKAKKAGKSFADGNRDKRLYYKVISYKQKDTVFVEKDKVREMYCG